MFHEIKITVVGTGYVGLVSGACFSELGYDVICVDKDEEKINKLKSVEIPIYEAGLKDLVHSNFVIHKRLKFTTDLQAAVASCNVIFIAVNTPTRLEDGRVDLTYVENAAKEIAGLLNEYKLIVMKSTVSVGTGRHLKSIIKKINPNARFDMVSNPEFLREGSAVADFMSPDRIVIGTETPAAKSIMDGIYQIFSDRNVPILHTDLESSELIKYAANCFLATKIAFVNEIANFCEKTGADIEKVAEGMGLDKRIGANYLLPGPGFGGSCFPKDTLGLVSAARDAGVPLDIVEAVVASNDKRKEQMVDKVIQACGKTVLQRKITVLGLAFKSNTDDIRDSSALTIVKGLQENGAELCVYDPKAMPNAKAVLFNVKWASNVIEALQGSEIVVIVTEWEEFKNLDFPSFGISTVVDFRNLYDPEDMLAMGVHYISVGRKTPNTQNSIKEVSRIKDNSLLIETQI